MLYFWLTVGILIFIGVTYMAITEGFRKWGYYYVFAGLSFLMFIVRRWMIKRMERHLDYLEQQEKEGK